MGTASFSVRQYGSDRNGGALSSKIRTSGAFTTSTAAGNIEDAGGDISLSRREVLEVHASEDMRISFGGTAATASTGHFIPSGQQARFEVGAGDDGVVSIIDVA